jgi:hypothetical protein
MMALAAGGPMIARALRREIPMQRVARLLSIATLALGALTTLTSCSSPLYDERLPDEADDTNAEQEALAAVPHKRHIPMCKPRSEPGVTRCFARVLTKDTGEVVADATPQGYGPSDLRSAYRLPSSGGGGRVVAIVDAHDDPTAESDLATYRSTYGLPPCTTANGCFKKINQFGQASNYPTADSGWAGEISLDLDVVSAVCPDCKILLVEANTASVNDLGTAVNAAAGLGAAAISNSYGSGEYSSEITASQQYYNHPGILVTASSGDEGYGAEFPASSQFVVAVGGTTLARSSSTRGWAEGAWADGGSGCSKYVPKPSWQKDTGCSNRTVADVSAVADPNTGLAVYFSGGGGWLIVGGTSAAAPLVAGAHTLLNLSGHDGSYPYQHASSYYDTTMGKNGTCSPSYLCTAGSGYDGPTGLGTPNGSMLSNGNEAPYGGTAWPIPGTIEAEKYDTGGKNVGYSDTTSGNSGGQLRQDDVDIQTTSDAGGGYNVGWVAAGEWLKYTVNVKTSGTYSVDARVASTSSGQKLHIEVDGTNVTGSMTVPNTGAWQNWATIDVNNIGLTAGSHVVRVYFEGALNLNWIRFNFWSGQDVGSVSTTGSASRSGSTYTVKGSGADIWGAADEFRYLYQSIGGDATLTARVASIQNVNGWTKGGVMIRDGLTGGAMNVYMFASPSALNSYRWQVRSGSGGSTSSAPAPSAACGNGTAPVWIRVSRKGSTFTGYCSPDGSSWTLVGSASASMSATVQMGLAVTSHLDGTLAAGTFDSVSITTP